MQVKARLIGVNHNETLVRVQKPTPGLKVKTHVKAGIQIQFEWFERDRDVSE